MKREWDLSEVHYSIRYCKEVIMSILAPSYSWCIRGDQKSRVWVFGTLKGDSEGRL
jgi:hypothetical protein